MIQKVALIGNGRAGRFFELCLPAKNIATEVFARHPKTANQREWPAQLVQADLVLLCVSDEAIAPVSAQLPTGNYLVAHISGAAPLTEISAKHKRSAIFYPLMSLSAQSRVNVEDIPFCLEAAQSNDLLLLEKLALQLGAQSYRINSRQRPYIHLAAVLAHNFSNHLFHLAYKVLEQQAIDFSVLKPLLQQAVSNLSHTDPAAAQTGPAVRKDEKTIQRHLQILNDPEIKEIYNLLTQSIQRKHHEKL